jgi:hypothetical protein
LLGVHGQQVLLFLVLEDQVPGVNFMKPFQSKLQM